ncbi:paladin-like [Saccostrea echinata]|uniref:paladin-like n=1 Tax=Saccostrea echinata TaxID=191078 RepID=UPI002A7FC779|nr:paladin-like [Saccostrea echinata]
MGSGSSTLTPPSSPEPDSPILSHRALSPEKQKSRNFVRAGNDVAPIIIRDCKEEFQHVTDFKDPIIYGSITENMPRHPLVKGKYFLVRDASDKSDIKKTYAQYKAPNFHQASKGLPVYGAGQPTEKGLIYLIDHLVDEGHTEVLLFNLREEPVLFVESASDMLPYSIREKESLKELVNLGRSSYEADEAEARIRKEVIDLATLKEENKFYFYKDLENLHREPHEFYVQYEDHLLVSEEVYSRHILCSHCVRYRRLCFPQESAPSDMDVDSFIDVYKECPSGFDKTHGSSMAMLFTCHVGYGRTTLGMVMGSLLLAHRNGFSSILSKTHKSSGEEIDCGAVHRLVSLIPDGQKIKHQIDAVIDMCGELYNLHSEISAAKHLLEGTTFDQEIDGKNAQEMLYKRCCHFLQRYLFLICFNSYLTEQFSQRFLKSYSKWKRQHPEMIRLLENVHHPNSHAPLNLVLTERQFLVADVYIGLDVMSTQMDVRVPNFRKLNLKGFSVYGMAQPARDGVTKISNYLLSKKQGHKLVVLVNLRNDVAVECDGQTYSVRDSTLLDEPIIHPGLTVEELEDKEETLTKIIKTNKIKIYNELSDEPVEREFNSVLTSSELAENQKLQTLDMQYFRVPLQYDTTPTEQDFDDLMTVIHKNGFSDDQECNKTAIVYYCRTGKSRTTLALAVTGLIMCHLRGFPKGANLGEQERVSCPNAQYTKGDFMIVQKLVRLLPNGQQVKREVDFILDECFETMSPMHFHIREVIFVTYNKITKAKSEIEKQQLKRQSLEALERYIYLILFNMYLRYDKKIKWRRTFSQWMREVAVNAGVFELLDNLAFYDFEKLPTAYKTMNERWTNRSQPIPFAGEFK